MSSLLRTKGVQIGQDNTATNNFTLYQPGVPDGTLRIGNGNSGSTTDALTINSSGNVGIGTTSPSASLHVRKTGASAGIILEETSSTQYSQYLALKDSTTTWYVVNRYANTGSAQSGFGIGTTNSGDYLQIDTSGRVTMPYQPAFMAYMNYNPAFSSFSDGQIVPFNSTAFNNGNHFNTSTYIFTAPITGYYQINVYLRVDNVESTPNNYFHPIVSINNSENYNGLNLRLIFSSSTSAPYESITDSQVWYLAANDTVRIKHGDTTASGANGGSASYNGSQSRFSGYLIG